MDANGGALISDGSIRNNGILHGGYALYVTDGADPDQKNEKGFTLLQHAMIHRKYDSAEALLEMGADPDIAVEAHGETPLHYAAREGNAHLIGVMLHKLADVNKADGFGWTPLHTATACGKLDAIRELVEHGADLNLKDCQRDRPIDLAVLRQNGFLCRRAFPEYVINSPVGQHGGRAHAVNNRNGRCRVGVHAVAVHGGAGR